MDAFTDIVPFVYAGFKLNWHYSQLALLSDG